MTNIWNRRKIPPGTITVLRRLGFLLILAITFAQVHLCEPSYRFADGNVCKTCPRLTDHSVEVLVPDSADLVSAHGDCHDCCDLQSCDDHAKSPQVARNNGSSFEFIVYIVPTFEFRFAKSIVVRPILVHVESSSSTGPPGTKSSRAPPLTRLV